MRISVWYNTSPMPIKRKGFGKKGDVLDDMGDVYLWATTMRKLARELRKNMTPAEKVLWRALRNKKLHGLKFYRQTAIDRYIADFYCPSKNLVVEVDGGIHHHDRDQMERDEVRDEFMKKKRLRILRVKNGEVFKDLDSVLKKIAGMCGVLEGGDLRK